MSDIDISQWEVCESDEQCKVDSFRQHLGLCDSLFGFKVAHEILLRSGNDLDRAIRDIDKRREVMKSACPKIKDPQIVMDYYYKYYKSCASSHTRSMETSSINVERSHGIPKSIYFMSYNYFLRKFDDDDKKDV
eukprot:scaffold2425_cov76-Skeletonema_dohrnii-CCMP3373.AAC.20